MPVRSPCIGMCWNIDEKRNACLGCFRSLDEVAEWDDMTDAQRRATLKRCKQRSKELFGISGGKHGS